MSSSKDEQSIKWKSPSQDENKGAWKSNNQEENKGNWMNMHDNVAWNKAPNTGKVN